MNTNIMNSIKLQPPYSPQCCNGLYYDRSFYFLPTLVTPSSCGKWWWWIRRKWQLHIFSGSRINVVLVPHWLLFPPPHSRQQEWAGRKKAWSSCLNRSDASAALTHRLMSHCHILQAMQNFERRPSPSESHHNCPDIQAKNHSIFLDYSSLACEVSCQILLILSLKSQTHSLNSILTFQVFLLLALYFFPPYPTQIHPPHCCLQKYFSKM